mmetsp:Transcript_61554/g.133225  ORF Transcript_61554/g.133225 Transcript_61554/m.133225 type:complete len:268 (-) Transcript_61554:589-1392(-)
MRDHHAPSLGHAVYARRHGLGDAADLVDLQQQSVDSIPVLGIRDALWIGDQEIIPDDLHLVAHDLDHLREALPVILVEGIFDGHDGVPADDVTVEVHHFGLSLVQRGVRSIHLEAEVIDLILCNPEFCRCHIHGELHFACVTSLLDGLHEALQPFIVILNVGCKATFVANRSCILAVPRFHYVLQHVVDLCAKLQGLLEGLRAQGRNHEFLHRQLVARVLTPVDHIHHRNGHLVLPGGCPLNVDVWHAEVRCLELTDVLIEIESKCT